ncbi:MAG: hypothetical protein J0J04_07945 [Microbacterium sp.]|uniref:hypothetical protein n=1 Tax=Microbacterium sp. TaxID=51671 RepID=UPI001ACA1E50|nr:hypothetical protein [Microbacterium sp.]MBN9214731.1 hypothetical protein [Microbacterium sp.]
MTGRVVLLVELPEGDVIAVEFSSRNDADRWEESCSFEVVGRPQVMGPRKFEQHFAPGGSFRT